MKSLWGLFLLFTIVVCFFMNVLGMIYYSYMATNAPSHHLLYLGLAIWCTGLSYYGSTILRQLYTEAKKVVDEQPKQ
jgi:hypothetical protein